MANFVTFNPLNVSVTINSYIISGFADGDYISVAPNSDLGAPGNDLGGVPYFFETNDNNWTLTLKLHQMSPSNTDLSALKRTAKETGKNVFAISVVDTATGSYIETAKGVLQRSPNHDYSNSFSDRTWVFAMLEVKEEEKGAPRGN